MTETKARQIFEKYNPESAVTRCPNGRAPVRKMLDAYAKAAVNLYGVIPICDFVDIFNRQNTEQTNAEEVFVLLLPLVLKKKWYCFYKEAIVHYWAMEDFDYADAWLRVQGDKPRFIPEKDEFLQFENQHHKDASQESHWLKLLDFVDKAWPGNYQKYRFYYDLKDISEFSSGVQEVSDLLDQYGLGFKDEKQIKMFFDLLMEARNNTRLWSNKGYSPSELGAILESQRPKNASPEIVTQKRRKIGANEPCPCGSGKKYKKCCRLIEEARSAQLSSSECTLFYETWYGLMGFINERKKVIVQTIKPLYPNPVSDEQVYKVREVLWKNPKLIDDYLDVAKPSEEKTELLRAWRDHHKKGMFFLVEYTPEYAVVIGSNKDREDRLYGVKGISRSLADAMQRELPLQFEAVLLPFKDKIIYDSFLSSIPIAFGDGMKRAFREMYDKAQPYGIITHLEAGDGDEKA